MKDICISIIWLSAAISAFALAMAVVISIVKSFWERWDSWDE